jgi:hypothetical protein
VIVPIDRLVQPTELDLAAAVVTDTGRNKEQVDPVKVLLG